MIGHYDRKEETHLTNEELLAKMQESIKREAEEIKKSFPQAPFPMMYPYMPIAPGMQNAAVQLFHGQLHGWITGCYSILFLNVLRTESAQFYGTSWCGY